MNARSLLSMVGIGALFGINTDFGNKVKMVKGNNYYKKHGKTFTRGKRSKSLKVRSNRMKAKAKAKR